MIGSISAGNIGWLINRLGSNKNKYTCNRGMIVAVTTGGVQVEKWVSVPVAVRVWGSSCWSPGRIFLHCPGLCCVHLFRPSQTENPLTEKKQSYYWFVYLLNLQYCSTTWEFSQAALQVRAQSFSTEMCFMDHVRYGGCIVIFCAQHWPAATTPCPTRATLIGWSSIQACLLASYSGHMQRVTAVGFLLLYRTKTIKIWGDWVDSAQMKPLPLVVTILHS